MRRVIFILPLLTLLPLGCGDFQEKYPHYPSWGWWDHPAEEAKTQTAATQSPAEPDDAETPDTEAGTQGRAQAPPGGRTERPDPTAEELSRNPELQDAPAAELLAELEGRSPREEPDALTTHREAVWPRVQALRDSGSLPPDQRDALLRRARADLPGWYAPLDVAAPDPDSDDWITVLVWDFMPAEQFENTVDQWRQVAEMEGKSLPSPLSRRGMMQFVKEMTSAE